MTEPDPTAEQSPGQTTGHPSGPTADRDTGSASGQKRGRPGLLAALGPGLLVAATGVGAGDLATAAFTGSQLGTAVLWAVVVGAALKFALNEGIARWQLATGETLLEGGAARLGRAAAPLFLPYLLLWTFFVGSALMSACGAVTHAIVPVFDDPARGKLVFGIVHSILGAVLVTLGGFRFFERIMGVCIALMFTVVVITAALLWPGTEAVARGLFIPSIPAADGQGTVWTVALMGGVGGTLTVLCYGYWIREKGRTGLGDLRACRVDLAAGYSMTAVFGVAMVIIGSTVVISGKGSALIVVLAERLDGPLGASGKWAFLIGAWGAVFSSLLGVWQSVPYLFADCWRIHRTTRARSNGTQPPPSAALTETPAYRAYLLGITFVPMLGLLVSFREIQKLYAVIGALFIPALALLLLIMNGRVRWLGQAKNSFLGNAALVAALAFFAWLAVSKWLS
ncbi:MAG: Nramp family divalent metal transporter [Myxococcota bacterium]